MHKFNKELKALNFNAFKVVAGDFIFYYLRVLTPQNL